MILKTRLGVTVYLLTLSVFGLVGCTPGPVSEVSQRSNVEEGQSNGETLVFATSKFSITSPPVIWRTIKERKTVISWKNRITGSVIYVQAIAPVNISYPVILFFHEPNVSQNYPLREAQWQQ